MPQKISAIARNASYFTLALILQKIISFSYFTVIARALGPEDLGRYYFAISFTTIFSLIIDLGFANLLAREVAKTAEQAEKFLNNILALKIPLSAIALTAVLILINAAGYPSLTRTLVYLSAIAMTLDSFTSTFYAVSRGFHNLFYESIAAVSYQLIVLTVGLLVLRLDLGLPWLLAVLALASAFNFIYSFCLIRLKWKLKIIPRLDIALIKLILRISFPFALFAAFSRLYLYLDSVLLSLLAGDKYVGIYQISFKIIFALQFLPMAFTASLYPAMSVYWVRNREQLAVTFERSMGYLIIISLPIAAGIAALADKIILLFKTGYDQAILPLQINMAALLFIFISFPVGSLLNACDRQKINTVNMAITTACSVALNLLLIPRFHTIGASITVLATNILMLALGLYWVPKIISYRPSVILKIFIKSLAATLTMALPTLFLKNYFNIFIVVIFSGLVYFAALYLLGGFKKEDVISVYRSFRMKNITGADGNDL